MTKNLIVALGALLLSAFPANAGPLLSLTGIVGDSNWFLADPQLNQPPGSLELFFNISSVFQAQSGPGGLITVNFSGPTVILSRDQEIYSFQTISAVCTNLSGCFTCTDVNGCNTPGFSYDVVQGGGPEDCCLSYPIDSSFYIQDLVTPPFAPYGAVFTGFMQGFVGYWVDDIVGPDAAGQPFSLTVSTVPEPFTLSLFGAGLAGAIAFRRRKRQAA